MKSQFIQKLKELNAPKVFIDLNEGQAELTDFLKNRFMTPKEFYFLLESYPGTLPHEGKILPLWEFNGDVVYAYVNDIFEPKFIEFGYEWNKTDYITLGKNYETFLVRIFSEFWEAKPECSFEEEGKLLNFENREKFIAYLNNYYKGQSPPYMDLEEVTGVYIKQELTEPENAPNSNQPFSLGSNRVV